MFFCFCRISSTEYFNINFTCLILLSWINQLQLTLNSKKCLFLKNFFLTGHTYKKIRNHGNSNTTFALNGAVIIVPTNYQLKSFKNLSLSSLSGMVSTRSFAPLVNPRMSRMTSVIYCLLLPRVGTDTRFDLPEECRGHQSATPPSVFISGAAESEQEIWRWRKTRHSGTEVVWIYSVYI